MKIGKFVETNGLTIDTVRHYMDMGLIMPEKHGTQYDFDSTCQKDLEDVLSFKRMGFSLNEIKSILLFKRLAKLTQYQEDECFRTLFVKKDKQLEAQMKELIEMRQNLKAKLKAISQLEPKNKSVIGVDFKSLSLLKCPKCGNDLVLSEGSITNNQIMNGKLCCSCGEEYAIEDGILMISNAETNHDVNFGSNYIIDYINSTNIDYLEKIYRGMDWINKKIDFGSFKNKVLLELGSGIGFFLRSIYEKLPDDCLYIAVDYDINRHLFLKNVLETVNCKKNMLFICSDFGQIPLKDKTADVLIDISGASNYGFDHEEFLLELINNYVKDKADLIGSYILFKNFAVNSMIKDEFKKNFTLKNVMSQISKLDYNLIEDCVSNYSEYGGKYENYFVDGEKVYSYLFLGKR